MAIRKRYKLNKLQGSLREAMSHAEWLSLAAEIDELNGADQWRSSAKSRLYDAHQIKVRSDRLVEFLAGKDRRELIYHLNEGLHGNMGGMGKDVLYQRALTGTKTLIQDYIETLCRALREVAAASDTEIPFDQKLDFFRRASHCYGRSALTLSGGGGLIYFHHGVVDTLLSEGLLPNVLSGASAGSWMCAQIGTRTDEELVAYFDEKRYDANVGESSLKLFSGMAQEAAVSSREHTVDAFVDNITFQEAFEHTGRYINISIAPFERHQTSRLMNAITSPNVTIRSAAKASSSVPGLVTPVQLEAKDSHGNIKPYLRGRYWVDGSMSEDLPFKRLSRLFGVNHYVVSMINPLAIPFLRHFKRTPEGSLSQSVMEMAAVTAKHGVKTAKRWSSPIPHRGLDRALSTLYQVLDQSYIGDINILFDYRQARSGNAIFQYNNDEEIREMILNGRRAVWPKLCQIRNAVKVGQAIDEILAELEQESVIKPHEKKLVHITQ